MPDEDDREQEPGQYALQVRPDFWTWWRAQPKESSTSTDGKSHRFVLYSGREVRPLWGEYGDVIETRSFKLAAYRSNPVVLADHNHSKVIGTGTAGIVADGETARLEGTAEWHISEHNPLAVLIAEQHRLGIRSAVSIGFQHGKGTGPRTALPADHPYRVDPEKTPAWRAGLYIRNPELFEFSSVAVPRDPSALQLQSQVAAWATAAEDPLEQGRRVFSELTDLQKAEWLVGALKADHKPLRDELARLLRPSIESIALAAIPAASNPDAPPAADDGGWGTYWSRRCRPS